MRAWSTACGSGLYDPTTGVYWAADSFATPMLTPVRTVDEIDAEFWVQGLHTFARYVSPWLTLVADDRFQATVDRVAALHPSVMDLEVDHRVINVDHRGHGRSTVVDGPYGARPMANDAADLLRHLEVDGVVVVGHSMGTLVASVLAVEHPALVRALVLVDPVYGQADEMLEPLLAAVRSDPAAVAAATFEIFYTDMTPAWLRTWHLRRLAGNPPAVVADALAALYEGPDGIGRAVVGVDELPRRACPILAIYAGRGSEIAEWDRTLAHGPSDVIEVWPEAGHFLHQEQPDRFATAMRAWLGQLPDDGELDEARR